MNCSEFTAKLDDYVDGQLSAADAAACQAHAESCDACASAAGETRALTRSLEILPVPPAGDGFADRAIARAAAPKGSQFAGRLIALAFVATLLLSVVTVIWTGLAVRAPTTQIVAALPTVSIHVQQAKVVNLVFDARRPLDDVTLLVTLPPGVEIDGYPGRAQIEWHTSLAAGKNIVPLELVAHDTRGGQLVAELGHDELLKVFRVHLDVSAG